MSAVRVAGLRPLVVPEVSGLSAQRAAHAYLDAGLMPHPWRVEGGTKVSCYSGFKFGEIQETHADIDRWRRTWRCGLVTSESSGLIVIDVDDKAKFRAWVDETGLDVPATAWAETGSAGSHLLFDARGLAPEAWPRQGPVPGGDIKSNGFVAAEPSLHPNGNPYAWHAREVAAVGSLATALARYREAERPARDEAPWDEDLIEARRTAAIAAGNGEQYYPLRDYVWALGSRGTPERVIVRECLGLGLKNYRPREPWREADFRQMLADFGDTIATPEEREILASMPTLDQLRARSSRARHSQRFPVLTARELAEPIKPMAWLIRAFWPLGSHGPVGGPKKVLKSYNADAIAIAVAAGVPLLGNPEWRIEHGRPVKILAGEGGVGPRRRRLQRIARDLYGIDYIGDLPLAVLPALAPFDSPDLRRYLGRAIEAVGGGGLTIMDSVYNYHPSSREVQASNVYDRGPMLGRFGKMLHELGGEDETAMLIDHFRKTGSGALDLDSISQAGMGEFADSWALVNHRTPADPDNGRFELRVELGSRQDWPGAGWELDWSIGVFDEDSREFTDRISVEVRRTGRASQDKASSRKASDSDIAAKVLDYIEGFPWLKTKDQVTHAVAGALGIGEKRARAALTDLAERNEIASESRERPEGGTMKRREVWGLGDPKKRIAEATHEF